MPGAATGGSTGDANAAGATLLAVASLLAGAAQVLPNAPPGSRRVGETPQDADRRIGESVLYAVRQIGGRTQDQDLRIGAAALAGPGARVGPTTSRPPRRRIG
jgi:hypothetical protein